MASPAARSLAWSAALAASSESSSMLRGRSLARRVQWSSGDVCSRRGRVFVSSWLSDLDEKIRPSGLEAGQGLPLRLEDWVSGCARAGVFSGSLPVGRFAGVRVRGFLRESARRARVRQGRESQAVPGWISGWPRRAAWSCSGPMSRTRSMRLLEGIPAWRRTRRDAGSRRLLAARRPSGSAPRSSRSSLTTGSGSGRDAADLPLRCPL